MPSAFIADAVSMPSAFIASLFQCLRRLSLRCFNAFGVCRFAVSMPSAFIADAVSMPSAFIASLFQCLRRFSLRCFNTFGVYRFAVSMPSAFEWLTPFYGYAVSVALSVSCPVRDNASVDKIRPKEACRQVRS